MIKALARAESAESGELVFYADSQYPARSDLDCLLMGGLSGALQTA